MSEKKAFIFDTNFIIQNKQLKDVVENLSDNFSVYVTQVSIDERIGQQCRDYKKKFDRIEPLKAEYKEIAKIQLSTTYDKFSDKLSKNIQNLYKKTFGNNIIPFSKDEKTFSKILERANQKEPPFVESTSDKGFKDALIWLTLLDYFKDNGEEECIFVTDDKGFINNSDYLSNEFKTVTKKEITIKANSHYNELLKPETKIEKETVKNMVPNPSKLRDRISDVIEALCNIECFDFLGIPYLEKAFTISKKVDSHYMEIIFSNLQNHIHSHFFEKYIFAEQVFDLDGRVSNEAEQIPIESLEDAYHLFEEIKQNYPDYLQQFYSAAATIFNKNYIAVPVELEDEELLPF